MHYSQRMKDLRNDASQSQTEIAQVLKTTQSYYAQYENGKRELPFSRAIDLALHYGISLDYLAGLTNIPKTIDGKPYPIKKS